MTTEHASIQTHATGDLSGVEDLVSLFTKQEEDQVASPGSEAATAAGDGDSKDAKPTPPASQPGVTAPGSGGVDPSKPDDPLSQVELSALLQHKDLGPRLQQWADQGAAAQVRSALERERARSQEAASTAEEAALRDYFSGLSQEELGRVLASDPDLAASYARLQQSGKATTSADPAEVMAAAKTIAFGTIIHDTNTRATDAGVKMEGDLDPQAFVRFGDEGLNMWVGKVNEAIIRSQVEKEVNASIETRYAAYLEEEAAKGNSRIRPTVNGRNAPIEPDLMETPSRSLLEYALETQSPARNGA